MIAAAIVAACAQPGKAADALKVVFVCKSGECSEGFERNAMTALGCESVLSPGANASLADRAKASEGANFVVKYGPNISERSTAPLVKYADTYVTETLYENGALEAPGCISLDKYDDGKRTILAALFWIDSSGTLTESSTACIDLMKSSLPEVAGWCVEVQVPSLPMR